MVVDAASAPARQLEGYRRADSVRKRKSAEAAGLACVADDQEERDWSLYDVNAAVGAVAGVAWDVARFETRVVRFLEAVVKVHAETAAWHRWAWAVSLVVFHV